MRRLILGIVIAGVSMGLWASETCLPRSSTSQAALQSMTVADLDKAGDQCRAEKAYPEAIRFFQEALRKDRKNSAIYNKLGLAELQDGQMSAARSDFTKAAKYNRKNPDPLNNIGAVDFLQKKYGSAAKYFKKAIALDESRATFHVNLGAVWIAQDEMNRAMAEYTRALQLDPESLLRNARTGLMARITNPEERAKQDYMMAKIYARLGDLDQCLECLKRAKEEGYPDLGKVYKEEEFSKLRQDPRLAGIVPTPEPK